MGSRIHPHFVQKYCRILLQWSCWLRKAHTFASKRALGLLSYRWPMTQPLCGEGNCSLFTVGNDRALRQGLSRKRWSLQSVLLLLSQTLALGSPLGLSRYWISVLISNPCLAALLPEPPAASEMGTWKAMCNLDKHSRNWDNSPNR